MTFSSEIKQELTKLSVRKGEQQLALLTGLCHTCASLSISLGIGLVFKSEHEDVIRLASLLCTELYRVRATVSSEEQEHRQQALFTLKLSGSDVMHLLEDTGTITVTDDGTTFTKFIPAFVESTEELLRLYLRGCYLGSGTCMDPSSGYQIELLFREESIANAVVSMTSGFLDSPRVSSRREDTYTVYFRGEDETGLLAAIGAQNALLKLESSRAERDFRNYINRTSNCETANIGKTVQASIMQRDAIECIQQHMELSTLPQPLQEAAILRMNHPDATLQELADLAGIGKSGMNHRLGRLVALAQELKGELS